MHFATPEDAAAEVERFNTVFVDAFYEGRLLCGDAQLFQRLRELALRRTRGLVKTREGWVSAQRRH